MSKISKNCAEKKYLIAISFPKTNLLLHDFKRVTRCYITIIDSITKSVTIEWTHCARRLIWC